MRSRGTFRFWKRAPSFTIGLTFRFADYTEIVETDREHGQFEVDIIHDGVAKKVLFDNNGNWLSTSWEISPDTLPEAVKTAIQQAINDNYVGYEADDEPGMVETPDGNYYRIELEAEDGREVILKIREDGTLLK